MAYSPQTHPAVALRLLRISSAQVRWCFSFLVGATVDWRIQELPIAEILLIAVALRVLWQRVRDGEWPSRLLATRAFRFVLGALFLSFLGYAISDFVHQSAFHDVVAGWARLALLAVDLIALGHLVGRHWHNLVALVAGRLAGMLASTLLAGGVVAGEWWRADFAVPATLALLLIVRNSSPLVWGPAISLMGLVQVLLGLEPLGAACILTGVIALIPAIEVPWRTIMSFFAIIVGIGIVAFVGHRTSPPPAPAVSAVHSAPAPGEAPSTVPGWNSFLESPFLGRNPNPDPLLIEAGQDLALNDHAPAAAAVAATRPDDIGFLASRPPRVASSPVELPEPVRQPLLPPLLGALTDGGMLGGAFFVVFVVLLLRTGFLSGRCDFPLRPLTIFLLALALFDLFALPFSGMARFEIATATGISVALLTMKTSMHRKATFSVAWN